MLRGVMLRGELRQAEEDALTVYSGEHILFLFMCLFSIVFLIALFLFLTTGDEKIFLHDVQLPFLSFFFR